MGTFTRRIPMTVFWALAAQGILSLTRLLTSMTVGGRFGSGSESQLGYYLSAFGTLMVLVALHEAFVTTPLTVFNQSQSEKQKRIFSGNMLLASLLLIGLLGVGTGIMIALQSGFQVLKPELGAALIAATALAPFQLLREFSRRWLLANLEVKESAMFEFLFASIYLAVLASLIYFANVSAISVFVAVGCVNLMVLAVWWYYYRSRFRFSVEPELKSDEAYVSTSSQISKNARWGCWVAGENVCSTVTMYFCIWFLNFVVDEAASGVFSACFTIVLLANPVLLGVSSILFPRAAQEFVNDGWTGLKKVLYVYGGFIFSLLLLFAFVLFFYGDQITEIIFGPRYADYFATRLSGRNTITATLGWAMPCLAISFTVTAGLLAANRPFDSFYSAVIALVVLVVANFSFAEPTLETAAMSFLISIIVGTLARFAFLMRAYFFKQS